MEAEDKVVPGSKEEKTQNEEEDERRRAEEGNKVKKKREKKKKKGKKRKYWLGCLRIESDDKGNVDMTMDFPGERAEPTHLVVMVNGLIGSYRNWGYAARQLLKKHPKMLVHCSKCNYSMLTFDGVDVTGQRLAEEVRSVRRRYPSLRKISFVGHSLGGLIARYAVASLYEEDPREELPQNNTDSSNHDIEDAHPREKSKVRIAGLEPINFITSATPHLGSKGHKQVPLFCGFYALERLASHISWCLGRTGKHLLLTDSDDGKPPLLLRMVSDSEDLKFISALYCFKRRVVYANTSFDHLVGWCTSSIRRFDELPKLQRHSVSVKYPHIVNVESPSTVSNHQEVRLGAMSSGFKNFDIQEEMIRGLAKLSWERVDVNFRGSMQRFMAHNTIQVKTLCINSAGADVIEHMIDNFLQ